MRFLATSVIMGASAAGGAFDFGTLGNLILELDATDSPKSYSSGSLVSQWDDLSGNGNHAVASAGDEADDATRTIGGKTALEFDGAATKYSISGITQPAAGTIALVCVWDDVSSTDVVYGTGAADLATPGCMGFNIGGSNTFRARIGDGTSRSQPTIGTLSNGTAFVVVGAWDANDAIARVGNSEDALTHSLGGLGSGTMWIGTTEGDDTLILDGAIAHVVMYDELLSAANRATLVSELASIYGISP